MPPTVDRPDRYEAMPTGVIGPPGLAAARVATSRPLILATFAPPGARDSEYVPYFAYEGQEWTRADFERRPGETVTALGVRPNGHVLFVGTSEGRVLRRHASSVPPSWEEVYAAPAGTFQPAVADFTFEDLAVFVSLRGVLYSATGMRFEDWTAGLGDLDPAIQRRGRFGTSAAAPVGNRLLVSIGGLMPGATGTWVRIPDGRWERTTIPGDHELAVVDGAVIAIRQSASDLPVARVSFDAGRTWRNSGVGPPGGFLDVAGSNVGAVAFAGRDGLFLLRSDLTWEPLVRVETGRSGFAVSGRDVYVPSATGLQRFRIERPLPGDAVFCGLEQTRQGREWYVQNEAMRSCLWDAYAAGRAARLITYSYTIEGGPIVKTITVESGRVRIALDSADGFGFVGDVELECGALERAGGPSFEATGCKGGPEDRLHL